MAAQGWTPVTTTDTSAWKPVQQTPAAKPEPESFFHSLASQLGVSPEQLKSKAADTAAHPLKGFLDTVDPTTQALHLLEGLYQQGKLSVSEAAQAIKSAKSGDANTAIVHGVQAVPIMGPAMVKAANQANATATGDGGYLDNLKSLVTNPGAMGTLVGASAQAAPVVAGAIEAAPAGDAALARVAKPVEAAVDVAKRVPGAVAQGTQAAKQAAYPRNVSIPADEANAQELIKALVPDPAARANIKSASTVIPDVLASAEKNGTPINGKLDLQKALLDRAQQVQGHYDEILRQNAGDINQVPENYNGNTNGGPNRASLQQISDRVDTINGELKTNNRQRLKSQVSDANAADADLIAEKQGLTNILHNRLAQLTQLTPEDIAGLRQNAGKMRSLAQEVGLSADNDTTAVGRRDLSGGTISMRNPLEAGIDKVGGGQEIIGNRLLKQALGKFSAQETPLPQPASPAAGVPTTPAEAQQAFLHSQALEQAAQDASAQRSAAATTVRQAGLTGPKLWASQGYSKVLTHLSGDKTSGLTPTAVDAVSKTPGGTQLLIKASDLQPGSAAMKNIVQKMNDLLGASK